MAGIQDRAAARRFAKARSAAAWRRVTQDKTAEYDARDVFADPDHRSYPLTQDGRPSRERTEAAWRYLHVKGNADRYRAGQRAAVAARIRAFARKHWGLTLQD